GGGFGRRLSGAGVKLEISKYCVGSRSLRCCATSFIPSSIADVIRLAPATAINRRCTIGSILEGSRRHDTGHHAAAGEEPGIKGCVYDEVRTLHAAAAGRTPDERRAAMRYTSRRAVLGRHQALAQGGAGAPDRDAQG